MTTDQLLPEAVASYARVTAQATQDVQFTVTRILRAGYDEVEVDDFLDRVWATLSRYEQNNYLLLGLVGRLRSAETRTQVAEIAGTIEEVVNSWPTTSSS